MEDSLSSRSRFGKLYILPATTFLSIIILSANNPDVLDKLEGLVALWSKVIEQVLAESEQVGC